jgi:hypothetical protein
MLDFAYQPTACYQEALRCILINEMPDWILVLALFAGYFAVMKWVLPRLGVPT